MSAERWQRLRQIFDAVLETDDRDLGQKIDELCAGDQNLRAEILSLLSAAHTPDAFLDTPATQFLNATLRQGTVLAGRFELLAPLGRGGMGEVWKARDRQLGEDVAIKTISADRLGDAASLDRFKREIQLARKVAHPNVCRMYDLFEDAAVNPPRAFLTMECIDGETLADRLKRQGPIAGEDALAIFQQVAAGVAAAHQIGIVHRDLKPGNVMLAAPPAKPRAVVTDFGLARAPASTTGDGHTVSGALIGTPEYMAPEQIGSAPTTPATDVYALGLLLFEMLSGRRPYAGGTTLESWMRRAREGPERLSGVVPGVQARIDMVIARCLEYRPDRRYQDASQLLRALERSVYIAVPNSGRFWMTAAAVAVLAIVTVGVVAWNWTRADVPPADVLKWYEDAQQALAENASLRALNNITRAIELAPGFAPSHAALAEIRLELDMPGAAQESMLRANALSPDRRRLPEPYLHYMDGIQALLQRDCATAVTALRQAVDAAEPTQRPFRMVTEARALERCDRPDDAQTLMKQAAVLDPRNAAVPLRAARVAAGRQEWTNAHASLDTAERLFRDRNNVEGLGEVLTLRGTFQVAQDRLEDADITLAKAAELAATVDDVRQTIRTLLQQAIVHRKRGSVAVATELTSKAVDLGRRNSLESLTLEGLVAAGNVHMIRNQFDEARSLYERALIVAEAYRHEEFKARVHLSLASALVQTLQPRAAAEEIASARRYYESVKHTRNLALLDTISGQVRLGMMEYDTAIQQFRAAVDHAIQIGDVEQEVRGRENLATALAGAGLYVEALAEYRRVKQMHETAGRVRGATFAALNIIDLFTRLGRFREAAAEKVPPIDAAARELRAQAKRIESAIALREGRYRAARDAALQSLELGANLSPERLARAELALCMASVRMGRETDACSAADLRTRNTTHLAILVESRLTLAEARLAHADRAGAASFVAEAGRRLSDASRSEHQWRFFALSAATAPLAERVSARERLTRELEELRLKWGEENLNSWRRRADVRALLREALEANHD